MSPKIAITRSNENKPTKSQFKPPTIKRMRAIQSKAINFPVVKTRSGKRIKVSPMDWTVEENGRLLARISQLPLRLAWAITVHKSQGMSLEAATMDLSDVFEFGQGYVALSRVRRLSGLYLFGWNERAFQVHPKILVQDKIFQASFFYKN